MTVTYTDDTLRNDPVNDEIFVPRYARTGKARTKGGVRTWMILAPIGAVALIGGAAVMMMAPGEETSPVEPAARAPLVQPSAPLESSVAPSALTPEMPANVSITETPTPVVREAPPAPPPAVQRRQPAPRAAAPVETAPVVAEPAPTATAPQPYTTTLNAAPASDPTRAPAIQTTPLN